MESAAVLGCPVCLQLRWTCNSLLWTCNSLLWTCNSLLWDWKYLEATQTSDVAALVASWVRSVHPEHGIFPSGCFISHSLIFAVRLQNIPNKAQHASHHPTCWVGRRRCDLDRSYWKLGLPWVVALLSNCVHGQSPDAEICNTLSYL